MPDPNPVKNRTIFTGDNLEIMRGLPDSMVDLIYLDPPFNSKHNYAAPIGSKAAGAAFKDTWTLDDVDVAWWGEIQESNPALYAVLDAAKHAGGKSAMSYLIYMGIRMLEMHRILKDTGSLYLHCDPAMSHYLKAAIDAIFGSRNFRNEIHWQRNSAHSDGRRYGRITDIILFYSKSRSYVWNVVYTPYDEDYLNRAYRYSDGRGRYSSSDMTAESLAGGGYQYEFLGHHRVWKYPEVTMHNLERDGMIHHPKKPDGLPRKKTYLDTSKGVPLQDIWTDIGKVAGDEDLEYPTQKPLALLKRIIQASSNKGDMVLDPFCGCATACSAAEILDRRWVGIDISAKAVDLLKDRLVREAGLDRYTKGAGILIHRTDIPRRGGRRSPCIKNILYGKQEGHCALCGMHFEIRHMDTDHKIPDSKGGPDSDDNLQLLCHHCNITKGTGTMAEARVRLRRMGITLVKQ